MDNSYLQITLGLIPAAVLFLALYFIQKTHKKRNLIAFIILLLCCTTGLIGSFNVQTENTDAENTAKLDRLSIIYAVAEAGESEYALQMLQNMQETQIIDNSMTLCAARLYGMNGNFKASRLLYEKAADSFGSDSVKQEYTSVVAAANDQKIDYALLSHFDTGNQSQANTADSVKAVQTAYDTINEAIKDPISASSDTPASSGNNKSKEGSGNKNNNYTVDDRTYKNAANAIVTAARLYDQFLSTGTFDTEEAERLLRRMISMSNDYPDLLTISQFRIARLQLQILCEDFKGIARSVDDYSDYNELLIVSELYIKSYLDTSHFPTSYTATYKERYSAVADQLQKVYDENFRNEKKRVRDPVKKQIASLKNAAKKPALYHIEEGLLDYTKSESAYDSTKVYLQLAKIENSIGNKATAETYLNSSLDTAGDCDDGNFTQPMYEIIGIISDKDEPERLKDVAGYVDRILNNTMTIQMPEKLSTPNPEALAEENGDNKADSDKDGISDTGSGQTIGSDDFNTAFTDYVSQKRASINIVSVDTSEFPKVRAVFNIDDTASYSEEELAAILGIRDCGADISNFAIEKVEYSGANILLCCDVSGSMSGNALHNLREAVSMFVENRSDIENLALMTFSSGVDDFYGFGTSSDELLDAAQSLYASGGTNMFDAVTASIEQFSSRPGEINCIILLSDGMDNTVRSTSDINAYVGSICASKGITLYSIGLGSDVDSAYLNSFAASSGGSYLYVNDSATLHSFYEYLHNQILNQYIVTFDAEDTLSISRTLKISMENDSLTYDIVPYSLESDSDIPGEYEEGSENSPIYLPDRSVSGLDPKLLYKGSSSYDVNLLGSGFEASDNISVALKGNLDYDSDKISCSFVNDTTVALTIPAGVACGSYDVHVTINGKKAILDNGLTIVTQGSEKTTAFGPYVFTSYIKTEDKVSGTTTLSGYVNLNGWLGFMDDVVLTGSLEDPMIQMSDHCGGYIQYHTGISEGLASYFAKNNRTLDIPALGTLTLYNDTTHSPSSDDYRVDAAVLPVVYISNVLTLSTPGYMLYPDRIVIDANAFTTDFPFQKKLLKSSGITDMFTFDLDVQLLLTSRNIGINLEYSSKTDNKTYSPVNLGAMPIYYSPGSFDLKINTIKNEYYIKYIARIAFIDGDGVGISLKWDGDLVPSEVHLYAGIDINTTVSGIPVTYSDFMLGLTDIDINTNILNWKFEGGMSVSAANVSKVLPKLEQYIGDVSVVKLEDAKLAFSLGQRYIGVSTDVKLFEEITLAKALIEAGNFGYTNQLLNMDDEDIFGLHAALTLGIMWESSNCNIDLSGNVDFALADKVIGTTVTGTCDVEVHWWIFEKGFYSQGSTFVGMYRDHKNEAVFAVKCRSYSDNKKSKEIFICWSKESGLDYGSKKL